MLEAVTGPVTEHLKLLETFVQDSGHLVGSDVSVAMFYLVDDHVHV